MYGSIVNELCDLSFMESAIAYDVAVVNLLYEHPAVLTVTQFTLESISMISMVSITQLATLNLGCNSNKESKVIEFISDSIKCKKEI